MEQEEKYVPLSKFPVEYDRFEGTVNLPDSFGVEDKIGLDVKRINKIANLIGVNLIIRNGIKDTTSSYTPNISGMDESGNLYASKSGAGTIIPSDESSQEPIEKKFEFGLLGEITNTHSNRWKNASILFNIPEIQQRILNDRSWERGVRDPNAWTQYFNNATHHHLRKFAFENLFSSTPYDKFILGFIFLAKAGYIANAVYHRDFARASTNIAWLAGDIFVWNSLFLVNNMTKESRDEKHRLSAIYPYGMQLDRYVYARLLLMKPLFKTLEPKQ